tara:strand:- start:626 stop:1222 length:597 start_codon:yes stop_codon:yes gene_type:complete
MATQITQSSTTVNERGTVSFTVTTDAIGIGSSGTLYFSTAQITGLLATTDFTDGSLTGSVGIDTSGVGSISRTIVGDRSTEESEVFQIEVRSGSTTGTLLATSENVTIYDTSVNTGQSANGKTFGPVQVSSDSDWYSICDIDSLPNGSKIALFVDGGTSSVQASYDAFIAKLNERNITVISVTNNQEDWIQPFLTALD